MKGRVALAHAFFDVLGGAAYLALNAARALQESGYQVTIYTSSPPDPSRAREVLGVDVEGLKIVTRRISSVEFLGGAFEGRLMRLRRLMVYKRLLKELAELEGDEYDVIMETESHILTPVDISYIHYPAVEHLYGGSRRGLQWRAYNWIVKRYAASLEKSMPGRVITNSKWTAAQISRVYRVIPDVVYPPVQVEYFSRVSGRDRRQKLIVTVSRFSDEKGLEKIVEVASKLRDYSFVLAGSTYKHSQRILDLLTEKIKELGVDNVSIETDIPRSKLLEYLGEARYYLHPEYPEHFGISIVEAMAAGAVPLVYRDGGGWHDIVSRVGDLLGYNSIREVPEIVRRLDSDEELYARLREKSVEVAGSFTYDNFKGSLAGIVDYVLTVKLMAGFPKKE